MKVLQINAVFGIRSTGRICLEISDYLNSNGHDCYIAYPKGNSYYKSYIIGNFLDQKLHALGSRIFGFQGYYSRQSTRRLIGFIESFGPDIVHLHNLHSNFVNLELLLGYLAQKDVATVITLHDCWFYTGKCTHYTIDGCYKWQVGCGNCHRLKKDIPSWFFDKTETMFQDKKRLFINIKKLAVVGVSDWIMNESKKSFLADSKIIKRIYNWIDFEVFKPVNAEKIRKELKLENKFIALSVASEWSKAKGLDVFIQLSALLGKDEIILLVGNIKENQQLPDNIIHIKETLNANKMSEYYSMADVFINLSLEESFGKVSAEALACGTPVISVDSTANKEIIGDGCGYLLPMRKPEAIINAISKLRKLGKEHYTESCQAFAKENFTMADRINDYIELYLQISAEEKAKK